jgi:hypothetical protein
VPPWINIMWPRLQVCTVARRGWLYVAFEVLSSMLGSNLLSQRSVKEPNTSPMTIKLTENRKEYHETS